MKKSVKEQVAQRARGRTFCAYTGEPEYEYWSVDVPDVMRIIRRACNEAYCVGRSHGIIAKGGRDIESDMRVAISEIINGPKKARGK